MYIISQITVLDDDKELYETYVGLDNKEKTLLFSAWGKTEKESRALADRISIILNRMASPLDIADNIRKNPLTIEECERPNIVGEGPESAEELNYEFPYPLGHTLP